MIKRIDRFGIMGVEFRFEAPGLATGLIFVGDRPVIWGTVGSCFHIFESREELRDVLRAAGYALGLAVNDQRQIAQCIAATDNGLRDLRTAGEARWRDSLVLRMRTEENDRCLGEVRKSVETALRNNAVGHCPVHPIMLFGACVSMTDSNPASDPAFN